MRKTEIDDVETNEPIESIRNILDMERSGKITFTPPPDWPSNKAQYKCEVCWTCKFFNILNSECSFKSEIGTNPIEFTKQLYPDLEFIPHLTKCSNWEDGER